QINAVRIDGVYDGGQTNAEVTGAGLQSPDGLRLSCARPLDQLHDPERIAFRTAQGPGPKFRHLTTKITREDGEIRSIGFPAAAGSAHTSWAINIQRDVAEFTGDIIMPAPQLAIDHHADADAIRNRNISKAVRPAVTALQPQLRQGTSARGVFNLH